MKRMLLIVLIALSVVGCANKLKQHESASKDLSYKNLHDFELDYNHPLQLDMNNDGIAEFSFGTTIVTNYLVEKVEFKADPLHGSLIYDEDVNPKVFERDEVIPVENKGNQSWTETSASLANRIYTDDPAQPAWEGAWKEATNKFLAVKFKAGNELYTGWIRMSIGGLQSNIILHDCAFSKVPGTAMKAGEGK